MIKKHKNIFIFNNIASITNLQVLRILANEMFYISI